MASINGDEADKTSTASESSPLLVKRQGSAVSTGSVLERRSTRQEIVIRTNAPRLSFAALSPNNFIEWSVIPRESRKWRAWVVLVFLFVLYNAFVVPMRIAFRILWTDHPLNDVFYTLDYIGDICFLIDIFVNFRVPFVEEGLLVEDKDRIAKNYKSTFLPLDILASLPLDLVRWTTWQHPALRILKLLRMLRVLKYLQDLEFMTTRGTLVQLSKLFGACLLLIHWIGCAYWVMVEASGFTQEGEEGWTPDVKVQNSGISVQYLRAIFFSVGTVFDTGTEHPAPDTDAQRGFTIALGFITVFFVAVIIGFVADLVAELNQTAEEFRNRMKNLNELMENRSLPKNVRQRVRQYCFHQWSRKGAFESDDVLQELPCNLRSAVSMATYGHVIEKVPVFARCEPKFTSLLTQALKPRIYAPGDIVLEFGEDAQELFFLNAGLVDIEDKNGKHIVTLGEGTLIGEIAFFMEGSKRTATVKARTWCDFVTLERGEFDEACEKYPDQQAAIRDIAWARVSQDLLRQHLPKQDLMNGMPENVLKEVTRAFEPYYVTPDDGPLFTVQDICDSWLFVGVGEVTLLTPPNTQTDVTSPDTIEETIQAGSFISTAQILEEGPNKRRAHCSAEQPVTVLAISRATLLNIMETHDAMDIYVNNIARCKAQRKSMSRKRFSDLIHKVKKEVLMMDVMGFMQKHKSTTTRVVGDAQVLATKLSVHVDELRTLQVTDLLELQNKVSNLHMALTQVLQEKCQNVQ